MTLEDLLEELVGPIDDEHDIPAPADPVRKLGGSRYEVDATLTLEELNERLGLQLPTDGEFQTIGGLVFHELGRVPERGTRSLPLEFRSPSSTSLTIRSGGWSSSWPESDRIELLR